jgi:hypothetical protein
MLWQKGSLFFMFQSAADAVAGGSAGACCTGSSWRAESERRMTDPVSKAPTPRNTQ